MSVIPATLSRTVLASGFLCLAALALILGNALLYLTLKGKDRQYLSRFRAGSVLTLFPGNIIVGVGLQNWWFILIGLACILVFYLMVTYDRKRALK